MLLYYPCQHFVSPGIHWSLPQAWEMEQLPEALSTAYRSESFIYC